MSDMAPRADAIARLVPLDDREVLATTVRLGPLYLAQQLGRLATGFGNVSRTAMPVYSSLQRIENGTQRLAPHQLETFDDEHALVKTELDDAASDGLVLQGRRGQRGYFALRPQLISESGSVVLEVLGPELVLNGERDTHVVAEVHDDTLVDTDGRLHTMTTLEQRVVAKILSGRFRASRAPASAVFGTIAGRLRSVVQAANQERSALEVFAG